MSRRTAAPWMTKDSTLCPGRVMPPRMEDDENEEGGSLYWGGRGTVWRGGVRTVCASGRGSFGAVFGGRWYGVQAVDPAGATILPGGPSWTATFFGHSQRYFFARLIDWLTNRSIDWLIDWQIARLIDWLIDWLIDAIHWLDSFSGHSLIIFWLCKIGEKGEQ